MIPKSLVDGTIERYRQRASQREATESILRSGSPMMADTPARVQKRLAHLTMTEAMRPAAAPAGAVATPLAILERILGGNDLISVTFLEMAATASRAVARIRIRTGNQTVGYGTGSLVGPRVLMTNNHVLDSAASARSSLAEFNYQDGIRTPTVFELDPDSLFVTDPALDYTLVGVRERGTGRTELASFGFNRLIEQEGKVLVGEYLNIVQHPNGEPKQVALRENQLKDILPLFLHYQTDTAPGSSGSPVFNDQWEIVALHHSGVPRTDDQGRYLTKDGTLWDPSMGEHRIDWIANEGARISEIVSHLKRQPLSGTASRLRDSIFSSASSPIDPGPVVPEGEDAAPLRIAEDGTATWTIPIQISIRIPGQFVPPAAAMSQTTSVAQPTPAPPAAPSDLQAALDAVEAGKSKEYFDEARDAAARTAYYSGIDLTLPGRKLFDAVSSLLEATHRPRPPYKPSLHIYPFVDLHPDRKLRSVYSQKTFDAESLVRDDFRIEAERARRLQERMAAEVHPSAGRIASEAARLEAELPFNCEHVIPQSWFDKREPMRGDLHHLFACEMNCNSFRANIPFFDFLDFEEAILTECGKKDGMKFEPTAAKGIVARATLYFILRYPGHVNRIVSTYDAPRLATLLGWHRAHPVTDYERHRNMAIQELQGNRNPLIDNPDWSDRIDFSAGL
jgi:endonuclease I/V8-like Glu-specific endopeptidase